MANKPDHDYVKKYYDEKVEKSWYCFQHSKTLM